MMLEAISQWHETLLGERENLGFDAARNVHCSIVRHGSMNGMYGNIRKRIITVDDIVV